jgi:predicted transcriptional regulator
LNAVAAWVPGLGPLESAIMTVIWDADQSLSVRVVRERLDYLAADGEDPAYTTVMSVMVILWRKGFLDRAKCPRAGHGRAWWYAARISREDHLATVIRQALTCAPDPAAVLSRATLWTRRCRARTRDARTSGLSTPSSPWCSAAERG